MSGLKQRRKGGYGGAQGPDCGAFAPWTHIDFGILEFLLDYPTMFNKIDCGVLTSLDMDECEVDWGELTA